VEVHLCESECSRVADSSRSGPNNILPLSYFLLPLLGPKTGGSAREPQRLATRLQANGPPGIFLLICSFIFWAVSLGRVCVGRCGYRINTQAVAEGQFFELSLSAASRLIRLARTTSLTGNNQSKA